MKSGYLLDTDIWIEYFHDRHGVKEEILRHDFSDVFVSEITIAELYYGALHSQNVKKHLDEVYTLQETFEVLPISEVLMDYATIRNELSKVGLSVDHFDLLIGATAIHYDLVMVTHNVKHYKHIEGLNLQDWATI